MSNPFFSFLKNKFLHPLTEFIHDSRAIGIILLICTFISLCITNLFNGEAYLAFWETPFHFLEQLHLPHSLLHIINDGLMAVFFFLAGMEIKRELLQGELNSFQKASLPVVAAIGGMLMPAIIFSLFNKGSVYQPGWAIPTATDIAFSLGVASLLGNKVPVSLKIFLTALAIIDDLGAIIIIALFYGGSIKIWWLLASALLALMIYLLNKKIRFGWFQFLLGFCLWYCMFNSGIHATVAGVLFAFVVPVSKLSQLEMKLHIPVYFIIMPVFAFANTAILIPPDIGSEINNSLFIGVIAGLFIGKPLGIYLASRFMIKQKLAILPDGTNFKQLLGAGILAGIGFTMSIFISTLAFTDNRLQGIAKIAVLTASVASIIAGYLWLNAAGKK